MTKERNYYIDFLKFIFSIIIVFYHSWVFTGVFGNGYFNRGYFAVDFYFIVTGYLFVKSVEKLRKKKSKENIGKLDLKFVWSRLKPLLPAIILITVLGYVILHYNNILDYQLLFSDQTVSEILFLGFIGNGMSINVGLWYVSAMLILFFLLFPLIYKYQKTYIYYIAPIIIFLTLGLVGLTGININDPVPRRFLFIDGFYKGLIFMNIGVLAYEFSNFLKDKKMSKKQKIGITILETIIYLFLLLNMHYNVSGSYMIAILFFFGIAITFSNQSYTMNIFKDNIFQKLGKFGFLLYLTNIPIRNFIVMHYQESYWKLLLLYWTLTIMVALIAYWVSEIFLKKQMEACYNKSS